MFGAPSLTARRAMIELRKKGIFSNEYVATADGVVVAELNRSVWGTRGEMTVQGHRLKLEKQGVFKNTFTLKYDDTPILEVRQPSSFRSRLFFTHEGREFEMRNKAWYSQTMIVQADGIGLGSIRRTGMLSNGAVIELPASLPVAVQVLLGWIAIARWDEAAAAASG
jgi:hypothetical protein